MIRCVPDQVLNNIKLYNKGAKYFYSIFNFYFTNLAQFLCKILAQLHIVPMTSFGSQDLHFFLLVAYNVNKFMLVF